MTHTEEWRRNWRSPVIMHGEITKYGWLVLYPEKLTLGQFVDIGAFTLINAGGGVVIEDDVEIGSHCAIHSYSTITNEKRMVTLKKGCLIGSHAIIVPGVRVGENSMVGAGTYLAHDVPPNTIIRPEQKLIMRKR